MVYKKASKSEEANIFAQSCQDRWIFFLDLEQQQALFYVKNLPPGNNTDFTN